MIDHESREAPPGVTRIDMQHGAYVTREAKTTGAPGWLLRTKDGTAVRGLNEFESEFIDSALRAAGDAQQGGGKLPQDERAALVEYLVRHKHCMSYNDSYFNEPAGELKRMVYAADRAALTGRTASVPAQAGQQPALKVICHHMVDGDDHETNGIDQFSGGRTGGTPLVALPDALSAIAAAANAPAHAASVQPFQQRVQPWMLECFGAEISADKRERNHRFFEESTELVQAHGMTASEAHQLVDYVYGRPVGDPAQEVGGVMVTLAALCLANGVDMNTAGEIELARIWTKVEPIRAKQAAKPKHSPLPAPPNAEAPIEAALTAFCDQEGYPSDGPFDGLLRKAFAAGASFAIDWKGGA